MYIFLVPSKGPNITSVNVINSTALKVTWGKLSRDYSNGDITKYEVCYDDEIFSTDCPFNKEVKSTDTMIVLAGLNEATTYYIRVRAATKIGFGELGIVKSNTTLEDSKYLNLIFDK